MMNVQGDQTTENVEKFENSSTKTVAKKSELADTLGISYGVCQEILRINLNMGRIATEFVT
jgi:hypothetical protein